MCPARTCEESKERIRQVGTVRNRKENGGVCCIHAELSLLVVRPRGKLKSYLFAFINHKSDRDNMCFFIDVIHK
jgi:hypothetical protein